jgi:hypothetical protein
VRVAHLVDELLLDDRGRDAAARALVLRDDDHAVLASLGDRIAHVREIGDRLPIDHAVTARRLRAALDRVARDGTSGEQVPVVTPPPELVDHRCERQPRVGATPRHDDARTAPERLDDRPRAEVDVRALYAIAHTRERLARVHVSQLDAAGHEVVEAVHDVVAAHDTDACASCEAELARDLYDGAAARRGVHAARVRDHLDVALDARRKDPLHQRHEVRSIALLGIARPQLLHDRHRDLGQIVEHEVVDRSALDLPHGRFEHVAPEPLTARDSDRLHRALKIPQRVGVFKRAPGHPRRVTSRSSARSSAREDSQI